MPRSADIQVTIREAGGGRVLTGKQTLILHEGAGIDDHAANLVRAASNLADDAVRRAEGKKRQVYGYGPPLPGRPEGLQAPIGRTDLEEAEHRLAQVEGGRYDATIILWEQADAISMELARLRAIEKQWEAEQSIFSEPKSDSEGGVK